MKTWKAYCPLLKGVCVNGFVKGMPENKETGERTTCGWFIKLSGTNPQTGEKMDDPGCSVPFFAIIQLEGNQHLRQAIASMDKIATEVNRQHMTFIGAMTPEAQKRLLDAGLRLVHNKKGKGD